jgi:D-psicose/D-tagatose/L-ribulose 3-epimerase
MTRIAISNIAWRADEERDVRDLLARRNIDAVEVAPSKIGARPAELADDELRRYRGFWAERGIEIVAMQALLFGRAELSLFGDEEQRERFVEYLSRIVRLGGVLGARALVFGSPKNRLRGSRTEREAAELAAPVLRRIGEVALEHGTCLCIEPNPPEYGCDWISSVAQARDLVDFVGHPGFGLHVDSAALHMAGEDESALLANAGRIRHFHASEPDLAPVGAGSAVPHAAYSRALRGSGVRVVSIEMRQPEAKDSNLPHVERALDFVQAVYG